MTTRPLAGEAPGQPGAPLARAPATLLGGSPSDAPRAGSRVRSSRPRPARAARAARPVRTGVLAALGMATFYVLVVGTASRSVAHLTDQARRDWYLLLPIVAGFGVQVGLVSELRRRHALRAAEAAAGAAGTGSSAVGMVACCAHHIADLAPFVGATGAAAFLIDFRVPFMLAGIGINAVGIWISARRLRGVPRAGEACHI